MLCAQLLQACPTLCYPMDWSLLGSSVHMANSQQEYWSGLPCPPAKDPPNLETEPVSPASQAGTLPAEPLGMLLNFKTYSK